MLEHAHNIIIYQGVRELGHGKYSVDDLLKTDKTNLSILVTNVQLPCSKSYDTQMEIHTSTKKMA